ncbi:MAG: MarR family transcriptional regulator [Candidatus Aenigmarchaeota archaeon]|nr:MarR family transcriptional regulator [Candidatus Aenigmarchaeota archaeon]
MKFKNFSSRTENKFSETELSEIQNYYEIGKWTGDRIGFPRVGIVNKSVELIADTYKFLRRNVSISRINVEIQCKNSEIELNGVLKEISEKLEIPKSKIKIVINPGMYGEYVIRVFTQSRTIFRKLEQEFRNISRKTTENMAKFIAGYADAEMTVEKRNVILTFSISSKNHKEANKIRNILKIVLGGKITIRTAGKDELKIHVPNNLISNFKEKIGKYMKHVEKVNRLNEILNNNFLLPQDKILLNFIKHNKDCTAREISNKLKMHPDSARRILRLFTKQGIINRYGLGVFGNPYRYKID